MIVCPLASQTNYMRFHDRLHTSRVLTYFHLPSNISLRWDNRPSVHQYLNARVNIFCIGLTLIRLVPSGIRYKRLLKNTWNSIDSSSVFFIAPALNKPVRSDRNSSSYTDLCSQILKMRSILGRTFSSLKATKITSILISN